MNSSSRTVVVAAIFLASLFVGTAPTEAVTRTSTGVKCTIVGNSGNNRLTGTSRNDVICGLGGNDIINGGGGNDIIDGGTGNDSISGGTGNDTMLGGTGRDSFAGGTGTDTASYADHTTKVTVDIDGSADDGAAGEKDTVKTDVENLTGGSGDDTLNGSPGANGLSGGAGDDTINGGTGNDSSTGGTGDDTINGGTGNDIISGGDGDDALAGDAGADTIRGDGGMNSCSVDTLDTYDANTCDIGGPRVTSFTIDKTTMDTSAGTQEVTVTFEVTDDLSGVASCWVGAAKVGDRLLQVPLDAITESVIATNSFGNTNMLYTAHFTFPQYSAQGDWVIGEFDCYDNVHNEGRYFEESDGYWRYESNGTRIALTGEQRIPITLLNQAGIGDAALPELVGMTSDTNSIDTSSGSATVLYRFHLTDDISICVSCYMYFYVQAPNNGAYILGSQLTFADGTVTDGYWEGSVIYPQYWPQGLTEIAFISTRDQSGKESRYGVGYPSPDSLVDVAVTQTGIGDATGPVITRIELVGAAPNTRTSDAIVTVRFTITDDLSGVPLDNVGGQQFVFTSDVGGTEARGTLLRLNIVSGSADGRLVVVEATFTLPRLSPTGRWTLATVHLMDAVSNRCTSSPPFFFTNG
jgi:hypothetical protein